jgi:hypothetical protein
VLKGVVVVPAVREVHHLAAIAASAKPATSDPSPQEFPAEAEVAALAERCLNHRRPWYRLQGTALTVQGASAEGATDP